MVKDPEGATTTSPARGWFRAGGWYYVVTVATAGLFAWVPFTHAARSLDEAAIKRQAYNYGGSAVLLAVLIALTPTNAAGDPIGPLGQVLSTAGSLGAMALIITGVVQQSPLRRRVFTYNGTAHGNVSVPAAETAEDPAVARVRAARSRRKQARELLAEDVLMARELGIGRPDLGGSYDDGGLVDLNSAPATTIAEACQLDQASAEAIVNVRAQFPNGLTSVEEALTLADLPVGVRDQIRDRAVCISAST